MIAPFYSIAYSCLHTAIQVLVALVLASPFVYLGACGAVPAETSPTPLAKKKIQDAEGLEEAAAVHLGTAVEAAHHGHLGRLPQVVLWGILGITGLLLVGIPLMLGSYLLPTLRFLYF